MVADFFRVERGYEINDTDGSTLVQILTDTAAPDTQADAIAAPVGSLWIINAGTATTTKVYQRFQDVNDDQTDWRDITDDTSWREPAVVCDGSFYLPTSTPTTTIIVDGEVISDGQRVLFYDLAGYDTFDVTPATLGTFASGIAAATYDFDVTIDGGGLQTLSVILAGGETYNAIAALMAAAVAGGSAAYDDTQSAFAVFSDNKTDTGSAATLAAGTAGSGGGDLFAALALADTKTFTPGAAVPGPGSNVYVYDQPSGTFYSDPSNGATSGDAVYIQLGTCANQLYFYDGTIWISTAGGTAAEEGFIRAFIGKDSSGPETPDYETPTESGGADEPTFATPYTAATSGEGHVAGINDNLELAIAKLNQAFYENSKHSYATGVTSLVDTLPTRIDGASWMVRIVQGSSMVSWMVRGGTQDGTNVDYTKFAQLKIGPNISGANAVVTVAGGALVLTVSSTGASVMEIRRVGTVGVPGDPDLDLNV